MATRTGSVGARNGAGRHAALAAVLLAAWLLPAAAPAQPRSPARAPAAAGGGAATPEVTPEGMVNLDFDDVEIAVVIDTIARLTGRNFIYDDRVRGRVTIVSPTPIPVDQAFRVFESVLQVKGFTTVEAPGGVVKVIPIRDAKESSVNTEEATQPTPNTDRFVTRLIPLRFIDADAIANTLKPLVSKEAALVSYAPTNTLILTDSASNIRRILTIIQAIDVETYKQDLAVIRVEYADATALAEQLSDVFGAEVSSATPTAGRISPRVRRAQALAGVQASTGPPGGEVRIITDARTNALIVLASRGTLDDMRALIRKLDVPVEGGGRIQVYYLKHADAEEMADTLNSLLSGAPRAGTSGAAGRVGLTPGVPQQLQAVSELAGSVTSVTADVATNSLVIQASPEGFEALKQVIEKLDIERAQVLVEGLIMEVTVTDGSDLGFNWVLDLVNGNNRFTLQNLTDTATSAAAAALTGGVIGGATPPGGFVGNFLSTGGNDVIAAVIRATATDNSANIISAPHILTSDNEEAEILVGDNIPIITNRVQSAQGITTNDQNPNNSLATSVNVERQDIGVTLRVTPQITEGESLRLEIFQEITQVNKGLQTDVGDVNQVGPALSNRRVENTVVVKDGSTVVIGGLVSDDYSDNVSKMPWFGDIPVLGWLFKTESRSLTKRNLLVFLTPHIIRSPEDLEKASIGKREEFRRRSQQALGKEPQEEQPLPVEEPIGILADVGAKEENPAAVAVSAIEKRYPLERMREIERKQAQAREQARAAAQQGGPTPRYVLLADGFTDPGAARDTLTELIDAGYEGTLVSRGKDGRIRYELRIGPYPNLHDAESAVDTLRRAYGLSPQVMVEQSGAKP